MSEARARVVVVGRKRLVGRRRKQVSVLGPLQLERAYYHCPSCAPTASTLAMGIWA
jgi:hypothetical protein